MDEHKNLDTMGTKKKRRASLIVLLILVLLVTGSVGTLVGCRSRGAKKTTPALDYTVYAEVGTAEFGRTFVFVKINTPGDYTVKYDGKPMQLKYGEYSVITKILSDEDYRAHVKVIENR
ncbi:MAG TPA: hypothetical protein VFD19_02680 [Clostridia bacterium]|nr:hypothetical protein [Clostridia bacterium]